MKKIITLLFALVLFTGVTSVSFAQDQEVRQTIEKQTFEQPFVIVQIQNLFDFKATQIKPLSVENAFVFVLPVKTSADVKGITNADYGNCSLSNYNFKLQLSNSLIYSPDRPLFAFNPITHSSGGMPFRYS